MKKRTFFKTLGTLIGLSVATPIAAEETRKADQGPPSTEEGFITWGCIRCTADSATPANLWPWVKMNLTCPTCGQRQPYAWHIKKFDPNPLEFNGRPISPALCLSSNAIERRELPLTPKELLQSGSRPYAMEYYRRRRARKIENKTARLRRSRT